LGSSFGVPEELADDRFGVDGPCPARVVRVGDTPMSSARLTAEWIDPGASSPLRIAARSTSTAS
jgi:hypothetical protein